MAAKLALIDKQLLLDILKLRSSSTPPPDFELTKLNDTQDRVNQVLEARSDDPTTQLQKVNSLLTKYDIHKDHFERTVQGPPQRVVLPDDKQTEPEDTLSHEEIVQFLPKTRKDIGVGILNFMRKNGITWDKQGKIKMMDRDLEGSNVTDIIHTLARNRKKAVAAPFSDAIYDKLRQNNIPLELIGSRPIPAPKRPGDIAFDEMYDPVRKAKKIVKLAGSEKRKALVGPWRRL